MARPPGARHARCDGRPAIASAGEYRPRPAVPGPRGTVYRARRHRSRLYPRHRPGRGSLRRRERNRLPPAARGHTVAHAAGRRAHPARSGRRPDPRSGHRVRDRSGRHRLLAAAVGHRSVGRRRGPGAVPPGGAGRAAGRRAVGLSGVPRARPRSSATWASRAGTVARRRPTTRPTAGTTASRRPSTRSTRPGWAMSGRHATSRRHAAPSSTSSARRPDRHRRPPVGDVRAERARAAPRCLVGRHHRPRADRPAGEGGAGRRSGPRTGQPARRRRVRHRTHGAPAGDHAGPGSLRGRSTS